MGRRSRKRTGSRVPPDGPPRLSAPTRRARLDEAPPAPWAPVPLTEILIFLGLVVLGFALLGGLDGRGALLATGLGLVTVATLELSLREHLAGYRSHSALLGGLAAILVTAPIAIAVRPAKGVVVIVAAAVFLLSLQLFREIFRRSSGGSSWRA